MAISKRLRFEVFKRDSFTCQYCGKKAPDVILHADHVQPKAKRGEGDLLNLVTACVDCNLGKSDKELSDDSALRLKQNQLAALQERREQIDMMLEWQAALHDIDSQLVDQIADRWCELVDWVGVNETGKQKLRQWVKKYSIEEVLTAMHTAHDQYVTFDEADNPTHTSTVQAFNKIAGICHLTREQKDKPYLKDLFYIRKIVENRCDWFVKHQATEILTTAFSWGADVTRLTSIAREASSWTSWKNHTLDYILDLQKTYVVDE